ncbi:MAG: hypothetical protein NE330_03105 [Lentisphaeraceae bacterium]|nr:hypothetical protein [Lentisphaeraceae bacterium]
MNCEISKGFFVINKCGALAGAKCHNCARPACEKHIRDGYCTECTKKGTTHGPGILPVSAGVHRTFNDHDEDGFAVMSDLHDDDDSDFDDDSSFFDS